MTYLKLFNSFKKFVEQDESFTSDEQAYLLKSFEDEKNLRTLRLSIILLIWSIIAVFIDSALIGGGVVVSAMKGINLSYFIPEILFLVVNFFVKVLFVRWYAQGDITRKEALYCSIPYIGSALTLGFLLKNDSLLRTGIEKYITYLRKKGVRYLCRFF